MAAAASAAASAAAAAAAPASAESGYDIDKKHTDASYAVGQADYKVYLAKKKLDEAEKASIQAKKAVEAAKKEFEEAIQVQTDSKKAYNQVHVEYRVFQNRFNDKLNAHSMDLNITQYEAITKPIKDELIAQAQKLIQLYKDKATPDNINREKYTFKGMLKGKSKYINNKILYYAHSGIDTINEHKLETFIQRISY